MAAFFVLAAENLVEGEEFDALTGAAQFHDCPRDGDAQAEIGEVDLAARKTLDGVKDAPVGDGKIEVFIDQNAFVFAFGDAAEQVAGFSGNTRADAFENVRFELPQQGGKPTSRSISASLSLI